MDEKILNEKLEVMTQTLLSGMDNLYKSIRVDAQRDKLEIFDKIDAAKSDLRTEQAGSKTTLIDHERRLRNIEEQVA